MSLLILDFSDPMRYLEVRGTAKTEPDPDKSFAQKVGAKYDADLAAWDDPGAERIVVTIEPKNVYAWTCTRRCPTGRDRPRHHQCGA